MQNFYIILGSAKSGRREITFDLIDGGLETNESKAVYIASTEEASIFDEQIAALPNTLVLNWEFSTTIQGPPPPSETKTIFFITDGKNNPIDQIEALRTWQQTYQLNLARILTVINCQLAAKHEQLKPWFEACMHFTDYALLNYRDNTLDKWIRYFQQYYQKACYPCRFSHVKKGKTSNPLEILDPSPRRLSHLFDEIDTIDALEIDENNLPETTLDLKVPTDPYLEKYDSGKRKKQIPDIKKFL